MRNLFFLTKWPLRHLWSEEQKGISNFLMKRKCSEGLQVGSFKKGTGWRRAEKKDLCKVRQREWLFQHCFRNWKPFLFFWHDQIKASKKRFTLTTQPVMGTITWGQALNACALRRFPRQTPWINKHHRSDFLILSAHIK